MSNKLHELTEKLYNEGLSKGQQEAETILKQAKQEADKIVSEAKHKAADIESAAQKLAEETKANADAEIKLAGRQIINEIKQTVENLILTETISSDIRNAFNDVSFIQSLIKTATEKFDLGNSENFSLSIAIPEEQKEALSEYIKEKVSSKLSSSIEIKGDKRLKSGFRIGSEKEGYYISFTDEDFDNLFKAYLRPKVSDLLFVRQNQEIK
ncbi:MAG: hypothetical protein LBR10_05735 [Prevotellaceae bacterium]|jgi:V/A-type H+-transporting ATPase subunit E|nr:hypothetical protein [Prevotellaceae bacterium]